MSEDLRVGLVIRAVDQSSSVVQQVRRNFNSAFASIRDGAEKATAAWAKAGDIRNAAEGLRSIQHALTGAVMGSVEAYGKFQSAMTELKVNAGSTAPPLAEMEKAMLAIGTSSTAGPIEAAQALNELVKAGYEVPQAMKALGPTMKLAQSEGMGLAETATIVSDTLHQFQLDAERAKDVTNTFAAAANLSTTDVRGVAEAMSYTAKQAADLGLNVETTAAMVAALANAGIKGSRGGTGLNAVLLGLAGASKGASKWLGTLSINGKKLQTSTMVDGVKQLREPLEVLKDVELATRDIGSKRRTSVLTHIFGREGLPAVQTLMQAVREGTIGKLTAQIQGMEQSDFVLDKSNEKMKTYEASIKRFGAATETLKISMGRLGGSFAPAIESAAIWIGHLAEWTEAHPKLTKAIMLTTFGLGALLIPMRAILGITQIYIGAKGLFYLARGFTAAAGAVATVAAPAYGAASALTAVAGAEAAVTGAALGMPAAMAGATTAITGTSAALTSSTIAVTATTIATAFAAAAAALGAFALAASEVIKHWSALNNMGDWIEGFKGMGQTFLEGSSIGGIPGLNPIGGAASLAGGILNPMPLINDVFGGEDEGSVPSVSQRDAVQLSGRIQIGVMGPGRVQSAQMDGGPRFDVTNGPNMGGP